MLSHKNRLIEARFITDGCNDKCAIDYNHDLIERGPFTTNILLWPCLIHEIKWREHVDALDVQLHLAYEQTQVNFYQPLATLMLSAGANVVFVTLWQFLSEWQPYQYLTYRAQEVGHVTT